MVAFARRFCLFCCFFNWVTRAELWLLSNFTYRLESHEIHLAWGDKILKRGKKNIPQLILYIMLNSGWRFNWFAWFWESSSWEQPASSPLHSCCKGESITEREKPEVWQNVKPWEWWSHCQKTGEPGLALAMLHLNWYQNIQVERSPQKYHTEGQERDGTSDGDFGGLGAEVMVDTWLQMSLRGREQGWKRESWGAPKLGISKQKWTGKKRELVWEI